MKLSVTTFGKTPAGMYLVRELNTTGTESDIRSAGKRITATTRQVGDLISIYESWGISIKTVANCLRLMRLEIASAPNATSLIEQLIRNVQIGHIKCGIRTVTIGRKAERVMQSPEKRTNQQFGKFVFTDSTSGRCFVAGDMVDGILIANRPTSTESEFITPELLNARSIARCTRQNKPHTQTL